MIVNPSLIQNPPHVLWLNVSPRLKSLSYPLLKVLDKKSRIACWEYSHDVDEGNAIDIAVDVLHQYLKTLEQPVHLVGHSTAGLVGLLYSRQFPQQVKSLSLLSVGVYPAIDWQAHYYTQLRLLPCSRSCILRQMTKEIFGLQKEDAYQYLERILEDDLKYSPSPHSLWKIWSTNQGGCNVPMFIAGAKDDTILTMDAIRAWRFCLKPTDRIWECPQGRYFFHRFCPEQTSEALLSFWDSVEEESDRKFLMNCLAKSY